MNFKKEFNKEKVLINHNQSRSLNGKVYKAT